MADVGPRRLLDSARNDDGDGRGQLILVTALAMAIIFVTLALILNTAIYTENLATRSGDIGGGTDAVRYHDAARDGVGGVIGYINVHNNSDQSTLQSNLSAGVDGFRNNSARLFSAGDRAVETDLESAEYGTRIAQTDADRNFTNTSHAADWTVAESVSHSRAVVINVTNDAFLKNDGSGQEFELNLTDGDGDSWTLNVTNGGSTVVGIQNGSGGEFTCAANSPTPTIDVTAGTVDGETCDGLTFGDGIDRPYDISFENGDNINGTYSMVVDDDGLAGSPGPHLEAEGDGQPFATHAVYSANVTVVYQTPRLYYNSTVRVAPGESDG